MNKIFLLKEHILNSPLNITADKLSIRATQGKIIATKPAGNTAQKNNSFYVDFNLEILISDYTNNTYILYSIILDWIFNNLQSYENGDLTYELDVLDNSSFDILIKINSVREIVKQENGELFVIGDNVLEPIINANLNASTVRA